MDVTAFTGAIIALTALFGAIGVVLKLALQVAQAVATNTAAIGRVLDRIEQIEQRNP